MNDGNAETAHGTDKKVSAGALEIMIAQTGSNKHQPVSQHNRNNGYVAVIQLAELLQESLAQEVGIFAVINCKRVERRQLLDGFPGQGTAAALAQFNG